MRALVINILLVAVSFPVLSQSEMKFIRKGNRDFKEGQYKDAEVNYLKALEENPSSEKAGFNLGNSLYRQENYNAAAEKYGKLADGSTEDYDAARYFYNLGNSLFKQENFAESVNAYKKSLLRNPDDMDAKHNLQMALRMLEKQQQQEQQQEQQQQQQQQQGQEQGRSNSNSNRGKTMRTR
jgi:tetratricopeptide (TPR) repeat protein